MDEELSMLFLFQGKELTFMTEFSKREPDMRLFLQELEACADKLDEMCRASHIAGTVNSSVGLISGILSILGLLFAPITAGASLALTARVLVTSATKIGVDQTTANKAEKNFQEFVEDSNEIQSCLDNVVQLHFDDIHSGNITTGAWMAVAAERQFLKYATGKVLSKASPILNLFFIGVDSANIYYHTKHLENCETQTSKWIRARVALWRSRNKQLIKF
uniref:Uncharacterized protein n=1 Tax=Neogobius melanostomus TaxID=47308 RepID=A0A8C6SLC4_9GOBI